MAKKSAIERDRKRRRLVEKYRARRTQLRQQASASGASNEERFQARLKLAALPRNGSPTRVRNRCLVTGRPRGYYRKLRVSRIALRDMASRGEIPGMIKSSW